MGVNDKTYFCRTHLGAVLHAGDSVMGYQLTGTNFNNQQLDDVENSSYASQIPDVLLVKKHFARKRKPKGRSWRLKRMAKDEGELLPKKTDQEKMDADYEMFLRDVEEDPELRQTLALYKAQQRKKAADEMSMVTSEADSGDEEVPQINMEELLDDMEEMDINDS